MKWREKTEGRAGCENTVKKAGNWGGERGNGECGLMVFMGFRQEEEEEEEEEEMG